MFALPTMLLITGALVVGLLGVNDCLGTDGTEGGAGDLCTG